MGAPLKPVSWENVDKLLRIQCTQEEIASFLEVSVATLERRCVSEKGVTYAEYSAEKKQLGKISLRRKQYEAVEKGNVSMLIWLGKQWLGQKDSDINPDGDNKKSITIEYYTNEDSSTKAPK